ncbi:MAG: hypothetical protein KGS44_10570, partial [Alphaproteobacteria bacterium]|nr:hypothetical protein [Alphaproteobacteria bacterium]
VTAGPDNAIRTWNAATGAPVTTLAVHGARIVAGGLAPWGGAVTADRDNVVRHTNLRDGQSRILATLDASVRSISVGNAGAIVVLEGGRARFLPFAEDQDGRPIVFGPNLRTANFLNSSRGGLIAASYGSDGEGNIAIQSPDDIQEAGDERRLGVWLYINNIGIGRGVYNQRVAYTTVGDALAVIDNPDTVRIFDVGRDFGGESGSRRAAAVDTLTVAALRARACALLPLSARSAPVATLSNDPSIQALATVLPHRVCE